MAPLYYFYKMDYVIRAASVTFSCLLVTSFNAVEAAKFQAMDGAVPRTVVSQEKTTQARSKIECAVHCRRYPHCASFAYSSPDATCYLHPVTSATFDKLVKSKTTAVFKDEDPSCSFPANDSIRAVTLQRSLWSVEANVTCHGDYFCSEVQKATCAADGRWSDVQCLKRVWRYPETMKEGVERQVFQIPGTVTVGWSVCVQGMPTAITNFALEIRDTSYNTILIHTSWRLHYDEPTPYLVLTSFDGAWGAETRLWLPPLLLQVGQQFDFKLTSITSDTLHIFMNNQFFSGWTLSVPLSSFSYICGSGDVNLTKAEAWCSG